MKFVVRGIVDKQLVMRESIAVACNSNNTKTNLTILQDYIP